METTNATPSRRLRKPPQRDRNRLPVSTSRRPKKIRRRPKEEPVRIEDLTPAVVARAAQTLRPGEQGRHLAADLRALTPFAKTGEGDLDDAAERLDRVMRTLYQRPGEIDFDPLRTKIRTPMDAKAPEDAKVIAIVRAARGRIRLDREDLIEAPDLAALVGVDESLIRRFARAGKLTRSKPVPDRTERGHIRAPITGTSARKLLIERGISPYARPS